MEEEDEGNSMTKTDVEQMERKEEAVELTEEQAEWHRLYEAAASFKKQGSWKWVTDAEIFGVCNPEDGEVGYCTIMGSNEELFGLAVFRGGEGLESLQDMMLDRDEPYAWLNRQKCIMVTFEDRTELDKQDLAQIKELGFRFRGRNAWPLFRAYDPGLVPWTLDRKQVCFLTNALEQAVELAARCKKDEQLFVPPVSGQLLVRAQENGEWSEGWRDPEFVLKRPAKYEYSDDAKLMDLVRRIPEKRGQWETDYFFAPVAVQGEAERPYYPRLCLWVDRQTRSAVGFHVAYEGNFEQEFIDHMIQLIEEKGARPQKLIIRSNEGLDLFEKTAQRLKIKIEREPRLVYLEEAQADLFDYFANHES